MTDRRILAAAGGARIAAWVFALFVLLSAARGAALPEPGPEDGGLRLRLVVEPRPRADKEGFDVRIDLVNISDRAVTLRSGWQADESGGVKDYLEAATSIECEAAIAPWMGGLGATQPRTAPQPEQSLKAGDTLSIRWTTAGRQLKNRVSYPTVVQNLTFPFAGLYSVTNSRLVNSPPKLNFNALVPARPVLPSKCRTARLVRPA